jgi:sugar/nucleoside kinase (ribokinase family)
MRKYDIVSVGELLVDLISIGFAETFAEVVDFKRIPGGSPANLCMNMARLGAKTKLVAGVGNDDMGQFLIDYVAELGVDCTHLEKKNAPTTLILVTRSKAVSNFEAYRGADTLIDEKQLSDEVLKESKIFHTTCFALSKNPAQGVIMAAAERANALGCQLSIDANYAQKIWNNQEEAQKTVAHYCSLNALVKVSEVDWERLYNEPLTDYKTAAEHFLTLGAKEVCVTLGGDGCYVASREESFFLPARKVEVKDTTGAGDAFWSGFLTAHCDGFSLMQKAQAARRMAELKLGFFGTLPQKVDKNIIYEFDIQ